MGHPDAGGAEPGKTECVATNACRGVATDVVAGRVMGVAAALSKGPGRQRVAFERL